MIDFLYIVRFISRNKSTFLLNLLGITLGLTSTLIIVGVVNSEFNYDSFSENSKQIYRIVHKTESGWDYSTPKPLAHALITDLPEIENAVRFYSWYGYLSFSSNEKKITEKNAIFTDFEFFSMFQIPFVYGDNKSSPPDENSVFISKKAANKYFGNANPVGKQLKVGRDNFFIIKGVYMDFSKNSNFKGDIVFDISIIHHLSQVYFPDEWDHNSELSTFVLINEKSDSKTIGQKISRLHKKNTSEGVSSYSLQKLSDIHINKDINWSSNPQVNVNYLYLLLSIGAMILIMSTANFIILYITISKKRETIVSIKMIFGATKKLILVDYLKEVYLMLSGSLLLSFLIIIIYNHTIAESYDAFQKVLFEGKIIDFIPFILVVVFLLLAALILVFILVSKKRFNIINLNRNKNIGSSKYIRYLVVSQFALCIFLIISTNVIYKQLSFLTSFDPGYAKEELITIPLNMHVGHGIYNEKVGVFCEEMKNHTGVKNITLGFSSPSQVITSNDVAIWEGKIGDSEVKFCWNSVFFDYFETLRVPIIEGRGFSKDFPNDFNYDTRESNYILNQTAVEKMGIENPIGKEFSMYGFEGKIIGVVKDFNYRTLHEEILPMVFNMNPFYYNDIIIRIDPLDKTVLNHITNIWGKFVPEYALEISYVSNQINDLYKHERDLAKILQGFTLIAITIAFLGLISFTIYSTQKRFKEIGIRKINGASVFEILTMLNKDYIKWVVLGFILICPLAWYAMAIWLDNFAFNTELNWMIFASAGALTIVLAIITVSIQSLRIAYKNPIESLRHE